MKYLKRFENINQRYVILQHSSIFKHIAVIINRSILDDSVGLDRMRLNGIDLDYFKDYSECLYFTKEEGEKMLKRLKIFQPKDDYELMSEEDFHVLIESKKYNL
jgi:hypothetical protein